jgi:hypothetical protein
VPRLLATATALAAVSLALVACGGGPVSLSKKLHVRNDTRRTVTLVLPAGSPEPLARGQGIDIYARRKSQSGVILVRVVSGRKTVGCLKVHYRKGQEYRFVLVSAATPCRS